MVLPYLPSWLRSSSRPGRRLRGHRAHPTLERRRRRAAEQQPQRLRRQGADVRQVVVPQPRGQRQHLRTSGSAACGPELQGGPY